MRRVAILLLGTMAEMMIKRRMDGWKEGSAGFGRILRKLESQKARLARGVCRVSCGTAPVLLVWRRHPYAYAHPQGSLAIRLHQSSPMRSTSAKRVLAGYAMDTDSRGSVALGCSTLETSSSLSLVVLSVSPFSMAPPATSGPRGEREERGVYRSTVRPRARCQFGHSHGWRKRVRYA